MSYYLKKHWKMNALVFILQVLWSVSMVAQSVILMEIVQGIFDADWYHFVRWTLIDVANWLIIEFFEIARSWAKFQVTRSMNHDFRADIVASLINKKYHEFHSQQTGEYLSWFTNDVSQVEMLAWQSFFGIISAVAQIVFSIVVLAKLHWSLLAVSFFAAILVIYVPKLFEKKSEMLSAAQAKGYASATSKLKDLLLGLDVLRFFCGDNHFIKGCKDASEQIEEPKFKFSLAQKIFDEGIDSASLLCEMIVLAFVGVLSIKGLIIQSAVMGCGQLTGTIYSGLPLIGQLRLSILASKPYFEKITVHADDLSSEETAGPAPVKKAITVENLNFSYGDKSILKDVNIRFEKGGKYALTGPSGCGKSTLLKLLLGWLPDYSGTIRFDGQDAKNYTPEQLQQQMSYIEQDVFLFNTTIRENITLGETFPEEQMNKALRDSALELDLAAMPQGLDTPVGENGSCLSGGQKQRVAIARALIHNRSILLVDEGTSALDQKNADIVEKSLLSNGDLTLILVSHHLSPERKAQFDQVYELEPAGK